MDSSQRTILINIRNYAEHKAYEPEVITDIEIRSSVISGLSYTVRTRVFEELAAQEMIIVTERKRNGIHRFKLTNLGISNLAEGLRSAGKSINRVNLEVNDEFRNILVLLYEEIKSSGAANREALMEIVTALKEESSTEKPKKSVMAVLLGTVFKGINISSDLSTIISNSGIKTHDIIEYAKNMID